MFRTRVLSVLFAIVLVGCAGQADGPAVAGQAKHNTSASTSAMPTHWVSYTDTAEGAFTMDVPAGWQVEGGMWRFGYFDARWMMTVRSLDGSVIIRLSDATVPPYVLPSPNTGSEGQPYVKPQQFQMMVASYRTAADYAMLYAHKRFKSVCKELQPQGTSSWRPTPNPAMLDTSTATKVTTASLAFRCPSSSGDRLAVVAAQTTQYPVSNGPGYWVAGVVSILTTPRDAKTAYAVAQHMMDSWHKNPQWVAYQNKLTQVGLNQIMANFHQFMQEMQAFDQQRRASMNAQVAGFESRMSAQQAQVSNFGEILTGIEDKTDPLTGESLQIFSGPHSNNYRNGNGVVINSDVSPGPGFHQI